MLKWRSKPDKPGIYVWGVAKAMDKFNQKAEDLWVAIHGDQLVGRGVDTPSALSPARSITALKELIHYKEYSGACDTCKHMVEKDHPYTDRQWIMACTWSNIPSCQFVTTSHHTCNMWQLKQ